MTRLQRRNIQHVFAPDKGLAQNLPPTLINERQCPDCNNAKFRFGEVSKSAGYVQFGSDSLPLSFDGTNGQRVMALPSFTSLTGTSYYLALTLKDAFLYDATKKRWLAMGAVADDCENTTHWTNGANVADAYETGKVGTYCRKLTTDQSDGFDAGDTIGYEDITVAVDYSAKNRVHFWIKSDTTTEAGDILVRFAQDVTLGGTKVDVTVPALTADTWYYLHITQALTTIDSCNSVGLVTAAGFPDSADVNIWIDSIKVSTAFTNTKDDQWTWCSQGGAGSSQESAPTWYLILTNGVDATYKWNGTDAEFTALTGTLDTGTLTTAKVAISYKDTLGLMNVTDNSNVVPQRFRFGDTAEEDDWTTGVAGYIDCYDTPGEILAATVLGPYLVIYKEDGILLMEYNASATPVYDKTPRITGSQFFATKAIGSANNIDYFLARDNVYMFSGLHEAQKIGDPIRDDLLDNLDFSKKDECFAFIQTGKHRITFVIPAKATSSYTYFWIYDYLEQTWAKGKWSDYITCAGYYEGGEGMTWGQLLAATTTWANLVGSWGDLVQEKQDKTILLGDSAGYVFQMSDTLFNYDDAAIDAEWQTKDFALSPDYMARNMRYGKLSFVARGDVVSVSYSTDQGSTWTEILADQALISERKEYKVDLNFSADKCRFKFHDDTAGKNFYVSQVGIEYMSTTTRNYA